MAYACTGLIGCDWDGTVGVVAIGGLGGIGTILFGPGLHALGGMFIIWCFPAAIALSIWGSDIVVYSSHGTDGSNAGAAAKSVDPGTNDDMGLLGKEVAWNPDASWLASKGMGW
jgi:hypothetical protein